MMTRSQRQWVWISIAILLIASAAMSEVLKPGHEEYRKAASAENSANYKWDRETKGVGDTPFQALLPTLLGFREALASLMWVQADDYFHRGEYRPIIRMVRQITTIDPHQLDVYATGAWHMAYNFMDKRLIPDGVEFLEQGCKNNQSVYDLFFEKGYMHYDKTKDYPEAVQAYVDASARGTTTGKKIPPSYVRHQLAHAIEKMGDIDRCVEQWRENLRLASELVATDPKEARMGPAGPNVDAARHNLYITERRRNERLAAHAEREGDKAEAIGLWQANVALADAWLKESPGHSMVVKDRGQAELQVERLQSGKSVPQDQVKLAFNYTVTRVKPKQLQIEGTCNVLDLARVNILFQDKDYATRTAKGFDFKMENCTQEWDNVSIRQGKFKWLLNLDRDPADMGRPPTDIYPLKADEYELILTFNPRLQAAFIQDRYGWNGEGLTADPQYLKEDPERAGKVNGKSYNLRYYQRAITLTRDEVTGAGQKLLFKSE